MFEEEGSAFFSFDGVMSGPTSVIVPDMKVGTTTKILLAIDQERQSTDTPS